MEKEKSNECFDESKKNKNNKAGWFYRNLTLDNILKLIPIFAVYAGVYGFTYQKGMIDGMGLSSVDFNYEIKEIYFIALNGISEMAVNILKIPLIPKMESMLKLSATISFSGLCLYILIHKKPKLKKPKEIIQKYYNPAMKSWWFFSLSGAILGAFFSIIIQLILKSTLIIMLTLLLFPGFFGYYNGINQIKKIKKDNSACTIPMIGINYDATTSYCTRLIIKNQEIWGNLLFATNSGYFLKMNSNFTYISRKDNLCAISYFTTTTHSKESKDKEHIKLNPIIDKICFNDKVKKNKKS